LFRGALRQALAGVVAGATIVEAGSFDEMCAALGADVSADLVLLDLAIPGVQGFSGLMYLRAQHPDIPVVIVSANDDPSVIRRCIDFGAAGFIPKALDAEEMRTAIRTVLAGDHWTPADIDLSAPVDRETSELVKRLAS